MAYSMKDLENTGRQINKAREEKSKQKAEQLLDKTSQGRGFWCILLWGAWINVFVWFGSSISAIIDNYLGFLFAVVLAHIWYHLEFTKKHPFWSSMFCFMSVAMIITYTI